LRIGVFGGTFDPPHIGHLILAMEAGDQLALERVLWVLTPDPHHKQGKLLSPFEQRIDLVKAAIEGDPKFEFSRVEIDREGPPYALDTICLLNQKYPLDIFYYLMGGDSLHDLPSWYSPAAFVGACHGLGVMRRPQDGVDMDELEKVVPGVKGKVHFFSSPQVEISAAEIRKRISNGRPYQHFLSPQVYDLICKRGYYQ
jgi:nicotinate-nucleotide adenylyltransferase